jgi:hypothetical protein
MCKLIFLPFSSVTFTKAGNTLATGWTIRGSNLGVGEIFRSRPDRPWGPPSLLYNGYLRSFPGVKRPGRGVDHPPSSSAEVKERLELYPYSPSGPSWPVLGRTLTFTLITPSRNVTYFGQMRTEYWSARHKEMCRSTLPSSFSFKYMSEYKLSIWPREICNITKAYSELGLYGFSIKLQG